MQPVFFPNVALTILSVDLLRYVLGAGLVWLVVNVVLRRTLADRRILAAEPRSGQVRHELVYSVSTVVIFAANGALLWLLAANGLVYLAVNIASGRFKHKFLPLRPKVIWSDLRGALRGRLSHADPRHYNGLQRVAYLVVIVDLIVLALSGLVLWKSVQFPLLRELLGGYELARRIHFFAMATLVAFVAGHLLMVALAPRTLMAMLRGR